jgi:hypothetical protein
MEDDMTEHHNYRGHEICLELLRFGPERIRWVWRIDGRHFSKGAQILQTVDVARSEALMYAQMVIERIEGSAASLPH